MTKQVKEGLGDLAAIAERDHEVQMARADLYKLAKYAIKLHDMLKSVSEAEGIEGWKQAKITTAADDISSVYHAMDYDMKFAESKTTKNVMNRTKTVTEENYTESLSERVQKSLKKKSEMTCNECGNVKATEDKFDEDKQRLDPKCWKGKKIGSPKTKMKGGVRVNNCVPA
jgi:hypothetical protein